MHKESIKQAFKFSLVGIFNTAVDYAVFYIMLAFVNADKGISQIFATAVAMCGSYIINKYWTFNNREKSNKKQIIKFVATNIVSMCFTIVFMILFHDLLHIHEWANTVLETIGITYRLNGDIGVMFCKIVASVFSLAVNFIGNKFWVFVGSKEE